MMFLARFLFRDIGKNIGKREVIFRIGVSTLSVVFAIYHAFFFVCFLIYGLHFMLPVNLISILLYVLIILMNKNRMSGASGIIFVFIPSIYAIATVYLIGWNLGAQWYLIALVAPVFLIYEKFSVIERRLSVALLLLSMVFLCYIIRIQPEVIYQGQAYIVMEVANALLAMLVGLLSAEILQYSSLFSQRRYQNKLAKLTDEANKDPLTNMWNRRYVENMLTNIFWDEEIRRDRTYIATVDIDHFKALNDEFGHEVGDEILKKFAQVMIRGFRATDVAARWGGEAFVVILNDTDEWGALKALENFKDKLKHADFRVEDRKIDMRVTIGFVSCVVDDSYAECIMRSNVALTYGKNNKRDVIVNYRDVPGAKSF